TAAMRIVEFGDFECPHCRNTWEAVETYVEDTTHEVELQFVNFPLDASCNPLSGSLHPHACDAAKAAVCAQEQDRFWEYAAELFAHQSDLELDDLRSYAGALDLALEAFSACLEAPRTLERIRQD